MRVDKLLATVLSVCCAVGSPLSGETAIGSSGAYDFTQSPENSELWAVLGNAGSCTVPITWPGDAARATVEVQGSSGSSSVVPIDSTATQSVVLPFVVPETDEAEQLYTITLKFYTAGGVELEMERKTARLAAVRGVDGRTAASSHGTAVDESKWGHFRMKAPIVSVPEDAAAMSVLGGGGSASIDLAQYPACRYAVFSASKSGVYALTLLDDEETAVASASVERIPVGVVMVLR